MRSPKPEESFQSLVLEYARLRGWRTAHFRPALTKGGRWATAVQGDGKGFPDAVLVREKVIYAELKSETGRLTPEQKLWKEALEKAGQEVHVWRPSDWEEIQKILF